MSDQHPEMVVARQLASQLSVAVFLVDTEGALLYYNPAAEVILGRRFGETGKMALAEWSTSFEPTHASGVPLLPGGLPLVVALREGRPAHRAIGIRGGDGQHRHIAITALPLHDSAQQPLGAMALFWEVDAPAS